MTHRERMMATIKGQPTDQIPWVPRMDLWCISRRACETLDEPFKGLNTVEIAEVLDMGCHAVGADFTLPGGRNSSLRGLGIDNHQDFPYCVEIRDLPIEFSDNGEERKTLIRTSAGDVFTHLRQTVQMTRDGISLPFVESYALSSPDDYERLAQVFDHIEVIPTPESYNSFHQRIGDRGLAVARGPIAASPMHLILHELVSMEQFFSLYVEEREALRRLAKRIEPFFEAVLEALLNCNAEVFFWGANYDQDITWPPFFEEEIAPWLKMASDRAHEAGKYLLTHTDGENRALLPLYPACGFDVAESVCPQPMTLCTLEKIRSGMGPKTTVWGGIPSVALLDSVMDDNTFEAYMDNLFENLVNGDHLILGVSDNVPPDANLTRLEKIKDRITTFGPVN